MTNHSPKVEIYTDGSADNVRQGPGGWGAVLISGERIRCAYGTHSAATNNYMEAYAVLAALRLLRKPCRVNVTTDSQYVVYGIRALRNSRMLDTNQDVWRAMRDMMRLHNITVGHVDGHSTTLYNELADSLASWGSKNRWEGSFYVHEISEASPEAALIKKIERRVQLRQERAEASFARVA